MVRTCTPEVWVRSTVGVVDVEGVVHGPGRMMRGNIEGFEVVIIVFNLGPFHDLETQPSEILRHAVNRAGNGMQRA